MSERSPKIQRALISVSDKAGLIALARGLTDAGVEIYSSGGTAGHLSNAGIPVREISAYTGFPELLDGRIKTLHPAVHGGILCRHDRADDMAAIARHGIVTFELVVVNLYPFEATVARQEVRVDEAIEQIDIGGPALIRAAAKNHPFVTVVTDPRQYDLVLQEISTHGATTPPLRRTLAVAAFRQTSAYDRAIRDYFAGSPPHELLPETLDVHLQRSAILRYGENPHQIAALYTQTGAGGLNSAGVRQLCGKQLSYNNLLDLDSALGLVRLLPTPAAVVIKHHNPCGAAVADTLDQAMQRAWEGDPTSAFGSVIGVNQTLDAATAEVLVQPDRFVEAVLAPGFTAHAAEILTTRPKWKASVRLVVADSLAADPEMRDFRQIAGGFLVQQSDTQFDSVETWQLVSRRAPSPEMRADLTFAWDVCRHVKSNAIVLASGRAVVGVGAGQMSRVDAVAIAVHKAGQRARGAVLASDAFFPFEDSIHRAAEAGVAAIVQPGGSRRDAETIAACNEHGLAMLFTGRRHFKH